MEDNFDIRKGALTDKEQDVDIALRPLSFNDFSGQKSIVDNLKIFVQ